jgi:hypothetical protein
MLGIAPVPVLLYAATPQVDSSKRKNFRSLLSARERHLSSRFEVHYSLRYRSIIFAGSHILKVMEMGRYDSCSRFTGMAVKS